MTAPVNIRLTPTADAALIRHIRKAEALRAAGITAVRNARLLEIAHFVSGPFPQATALIVTVAADDGRIDIQAIKAGDGYLWTNDGGRAAPESGHRTDGFSIDALLDHAAAQLDILLGEDDPRQIWEELALPGTYRVRLPGAAELQRATGTPPYPQHAEYNDIASVTGALAQLRAWADEVRPRGPATARSDRDGATTAGARLLTQLTHKLDELEKTAIAEQQWHQAQRGPHRYGPRLEIVVDRDPDGGTEVAAFLDGVPYEPEITVVDPGASTRPLAEWRAHARHHARLATPAAAAVIRDWFAAAEDGEFVTT